MRSSARSRSSSAGEFASSIARAGDHPREQLPRPRGRWGLEVAAVDHFEVTAKRSGVGRLLGGHTVVDGREHERVSGAEVSVERGLGDTRGSDDVGSPAMEHCAVIALRFVA